MDAWLNGYEHQPVNAGLAIGQGGTKVVLHTTETPYGTLQTLVNKWRNNPGSGLPHFISEGSRYVQMLPLTVNAYTLANRPGGVETNRAGRVIQVEMVGYSRDWGTDDEYEGLGKWIADLVKAGIDVDYNNIARFYDQSTQAPRLRGQAWVNFSGIIGHESADENDHSDPGYIDRDRLLSIINKHLGTSTGDAFDMATPQEVIDPINMSLAKAVYDLVDAINKQTETIVRALENVQGNLAGVTRDVGAEVKALLNDKC